MTQRIVLEEARTAGYPVVKRTALGQTFKGAILKAESRDRLKRSDDGTMTPVVKPNGKHAQELVVHCLTLPGTTSLAGLGDDESVPAPGDIVRLILKGKAFGDWIEAKRGLPSGTVAVGDVVTQVTTLAQAYDVSGNPVGGEITDESGIAAARAMRRPVGIYGPLTLAVPDPSSEWTSKAVAAYNSLQEQIPAERIDAEASFYSAGPVATPDTPPNVPLPPKPPKLPQEAWDSLSDEAKRQVAKTMDDQPPF